MRVFVAGASGAIGRPLVRQLVERGHEVTGMTRGNPGRIEAAGARAVIVSAFEGEAVAAAVRAARPDVVVNELTDLARPLDPRRYAQWLEGTNRLRREGTRNLSDAAHAAGASKLVSQSVAFAYRFDPGVKDEAAPLLGEASGAMGAAVADLERITLAAPGGIVLRYGFFYGPGTAYDRDGQQIELIRRRRMPVVGRGDGRLPMVHVDDAAAATVAAVERGQPGVYNVVDDEPAPFAELVAFLAELVGARRPRRVPTVAARLAAGPMAAFATRLQPVSNAKARRELGWQPRYPSWRDGFRAELG